MAVGGLGERRAFLSGEQDGAQKKDGRDLSAEYKWQSGKRTMGGNPKESRYRVERGVMSGGIVCGGL